MFAGKIKKLVKCCTYFSYNKSFNEKFIDFTSFVPQREYIIRDVSKGRMCAPRFLICEQYVDITERHQDIFVMFCLSLKTFL